MKRMQKPHVTVRHKKVLANRMATKLRRPMKLKERGTHCPSVKNIDYCISIVLFL